MAEVLLNQEQIKEIIPHRDPFLLIDEVLEMEIGKRIVARKYIKADDFWFKGHFQVVPGDVLDLSVEIIAQRGPMGVGKAEATVDGKRAVSCEIKFAVEQ